MRYTNFPSLGQAGSRGKNTMNSDVGGRAQKGSRHHFFLSSLQFNHACGHVIRNVIVIVVSKGVSSKCPSRRRNCRCSGARDSGAGFIRLCSPDGLLRARARARIYSPILIFAPFCNAPSVPNVLTGNSQSIGLVSAVAVQVAGSPGFAVHRLLHLYPTALSKRLRHDVCTIAPADAGFAAPRVCVI